MLKKIATAIQLATAQLISCAVLIPQSAQAESVPSPSAKDLYRIESDYMRLSDFPNNLVLFDVLMIDIDTDAVQASSVIEADLYLPIVPENLNDIVLFDGWHVVHFSFDRIGEYCIRIRTSGENLAGFDGSVGLFMFVTGYK